MKKIISILLITSFLLFFIGCTDTETKTKVDELSKRVDRLENQFKEINLKMKNMMTEEKDAMEKSDMKETMGNKKKTTKRNAPPKK